MTDIIFKNVFGNDWENLPKIFKKHYANHSFSNDRYIATGKMQIYLSPFMKIMAPFMALSGTLVPKSGSDIVAIVNFISSNNSDLFILEREFYFPKKTYSFKSSLEPLGINEVIEWTKIGIGWHSDFIYKDNKITLNHKAYCIKVFGKIIKIPLEYFLGKAFAYETAIDDNHFEMYMDIKHFLFGKLYSYEGIFEMKDI